MTLHDFLAKLSYAKEAPGGWTARCPSHEDKTPSLSVKETSSDKRILLHCFAGCSVESICAALGIEPADLFPDHEKSEKKEIIATYDYRSLDGELRFQTVRFSPKTFRQRRPDGKGDWDWSLKGVGLCLYKWPELKGHPAVVVCYAADTEILTTNGWIYLSELPCDVPVAQYALDASIEFVAPLNAQAFDYSGMMIHVQSDFSDLTVTPDHRVLVWQKRGRAAEWVQQTILARDVRRAMQLPVAGYYSGGDETVLSEHHVRLLAAYVADGRRERGQRRSWNAKKARKISRLAMLLAEMKIPFTARPVKSAPEWTQTVIRAEHAKWLDTMSPQRTMDWLWLQWPLHLRVAFLDEQRYWDGDSVGKLGSRVFTAKREEADIVCAMGALSGYGAIMRCDRRRGGENYVVNLTHKDRRQCFHQPKRVAYTGRVYCLTVPSGYLVTRRGGKVIISGNCEGEKDVESAWKLGLPATTSPMGAGKWRDDYTTQLKQVGVQRVAILPDNDAVGREHAEAVAGACHAADLGVRIVHLPGVAEHGDLSDYLETHTKAELVALMRNAPAWAPEVDGPDRVFEVTGDQRYRMTTRSTHIRLELQHLRRESHNAWGELRVAVNGFFSSAKHFRDGLIHVGDWNLSAVQSRQTRAKLLAERSGDKDIDWYGLLEAFAIETLAAESAGTPAVRLRDVPEPDEHHAAAWDVGGIPVSPDLPMVLFGDASSGKSLLSLWIAGTLASRGIAVLYADWEFSQAEQRKRFARLFTSMPPDVHYVRCDRPLARDADRLARVAQDLCCKYLVSDSIGFAADGPAETHEVAMRYFEAIRRLRVGTLSIAHHAKHIEDGQQPKIFGSQFFAAGARSVWYCYQAPNNPADEIRIGLYHRKSNTGPLLSARAYSLVFSRGRIAVNRIDIHSVPDLAALLPLGERLLAHLRREGPLTVKRAAEDLSVTQKAIYVTVARDKGSFIRDAEQIAAAHLPAQEGDEIEF